jgi:hypothetical protein
MVCIVPPAAVPMAAIVPPMAMIIQTRGRKWPKFSTTERRGLLWVQHHLERKRRNL